MPENTGEYQRWYDKDPALSKALEQLRQASDKYQAQVALNIIKIVIEHRTEAEAQNPIETLNQAVCHHESIESEILRRRWYDLNETLHSAMQLLQDTPDDLQKSLIPTIAQMIESSLQEHY